MPSQVYIHEHLPSLPCRIQPSPSLCLVVEVQAARDLDVQEQEVFRMVSSGWTRLELFDPYNQVHLQRHNVF